MPTIVLDRFNVFHARKYYAECTYEGALDDNINVGFFSCEVACGDMHESELVRRRPDV